MIWECYDQGILCSGNLMIRGSYDQEIRSECWVQGMSETGNCIHSECYDAERGMSFGYVTTYS